MSSEQISNIIDNKGLSDAILLWLKKINAKNFDYVAAITRRAYNLIVAVQNKQDEVNIVKLPRFTTENGLMMCAEEIAKVYIANRQFPKIAILDDILVHGRNMNLFLRQFWELLEQCLVIYGKEPDLAIAEENFNQCITTWIFAVNEDPILLRHEFQWKMRYEQVLPESRWRILSDNIVKFLLEENIANTSYIISAYIDESEHCQPELTVKLDNKLWVYTEKPIYRKKGDINHQSKRQDFYILYHGSPKGVYPSVRVYTKKNTRYYTPFVFFDQIDFNQTFDILDAILECVDKKDPSLAQACIRQLNTINNFSKRLTLYSQFVCLLLSQITLKVFLHQIDSDNIEIKYDTDKIALNFGYNKRNQKLLDDFCSIDWQADELLSLLRIINNTDDSNDEQLQSTHDCDPEELVDIIENTIYKQAVAHEMDAADQFDKLSGFSNKAYSGNHQNKHTRIELDHLGERSVEVFFSDLRKIVDFKNSDMNVVLPILSCLTQMMDYGDVSLKAQVTPRGSGIRSFYPSVRTTEMSLAIMPRKLKEYFLDFFYLARFYWRDDDFPERVAEYFKTVRFENSMDEEKKKILNNAVLFAELICENRNIANSMLNWRDLLLKN